MRLVQFILTITATIGFANATASRLADVMSKVTGYKTQLHSNVTAYDICMYLATGYQYNQMGTNTNITTEAYDDHDQGVARILTRHVNEEYDNTTEALNSYNKTQRVVNFDVAECDGVTDDEVISWYFSRTEEGTYVDQDLELDRRGAKVCKCVDQGQNCRSSEGKLEVYGCEIGYATSPNETCGCAEYGSDAAACQRAYLEGTVWQTNHHRNWGGVTALMIGFRGHKNRIEQRLVGYVDVHKDY